MRCLPSTLALVAAIGCCLAHDVSIRIRPAAPKVISINADSGISNDSPRMDASFAHLLTDDGTLLQFWFQVDRVSDQALDLINLECKGSDGKRHPFDLFDGEKTCGILPLTGNQRRQVFVHLAGVKTQGMTRAENIHLDVAIQRGESPELQIFSAAPGSKQIALAVKPSDLPAVHEALRTHQGDVTVTLRPSPKDPIDPITAKVKAVEPATIPAGTAPKLRLTLTDAVPRRPEPLMVLVTIPKAALPASITDRLQPGDPGLSGAARVAPLTSKPWLSLDLSFTSSVSKANRKLVTTGGDARLNAGVFKVDLNKEKMVQSFAKEGVFGATIWRNYLTADISTLNQADFTAPTQIAAGTELELQVEGGATSAFRGIRALGGYRHESDRDLKFQLALARFGLQPVLPVVNQSREYRARAFKGHPITAIRLQPSFYFDTGGVVRDRPQRLIPNVEITDHVSRVITALDLRLEIQRYLALTASDEYTHIFSVGRRPNRNYLNVGLEIATGYLFGPNFLGGIENSVLVKFQRGEQAPVYKPVNVFSVGFKVTR